MKTKLNLIYVIIFFVNFQLIGQIPDGGFNNWTTNSIGRLDLQDWTTDNLNFSAPTVLQDLGQSGSGFSAKLVSVFDSSVGYFQGGLLQLLQVPYSGSIRPNALQGYWKTYNPANTDAVFGEVLLYNSSLVEIGSGVNQTPFAGSINSWTQFSMPLTYTSSDSVAFYSINITWNNFSWDTTGYAIIDDIHFDVSTGISKPSNNLSGIKISDINDGYFKIASTTNCWDNFTVQVFDLGGKEMLNKYTTVERNEHSEAILNLSQMETGIYFCRVFNLSEYKTFKLIRR